jgi:GNAT superfamily N-acetyltransferase
MDSKFAGADASDVSSQSHSLNCAPRIAALELCEVPLGATLFSTPDGVHAVVREAAGDVNVALHWSSVPDAAAGALDLCALRAWAELRDRTEVRAVVSAVPHHLVAYVERGLERVGRSATFREPCRTWQPRAGSLIAAARVDDLRLAADEALSLADASSGGSARFSFRALRGADAATVNGAWKYRTAHSEAMVREAIATRPSVGIVEDLGGGAESAALAAWAVLRSDLSWGLLGVRDDLRRRGLGRACMLKAFAEQAAWTQSGRLSGGAAATTEGGQERAARLAALTAPYVHIKIGNEQSEGLFASLDFEPTADVTWVVSGAGALTSGGSSDSAPKLLPLPPSAPESQWSRLLALINTSYREDDFFFVDQERTDAATLTDMSRDGDFFTLAADGAEAATGGAAALSACVYLKVTKGAAEGKPFSADSRGRTEGETRRVRTEGAPSAAAPRGSSVAPPAPGGDTVTVSMLTIQPALKRKGLAGRILREIEARARAQTGVVALEAFVVSVKPWLLNFYIKHGFAVVGAEDWPPFLEWQLKMDCHFWQVRKILA